MKRREFIKNLGGFGALPMGLTMSAFPNLAKADIDLAEVGFNNSKAPSTMPQVIDVYLYGGPSELNGNLTNIGDINQRSQNPYTDVFGAGILKSVDQGGQITKNNCWVDAGGLEIESMLANNQMSLYRNMCRTKQFAGSHAPAIYMNLAGAPNYAINMSGIGTRLASFLMAYRSQFENKIPLADGTLFSSIDDIFVPFASFGDQRQSRAFLGTEMLPKKFREVILGAGLDNPFKQESISIAKPGITDSYFSYMRDILANTVYSDKFTKVNDSIESIDRLAVFMDNLANGGNVPSSANYPAGYALGQNIKSAVNLALNNPSSFYIAVNGGSVADWDNHNNAQARFVERSLNLMKSLQAACNHIRDFNMSQLTTYGRPRTTTNNIVINVYGDFGRRTNLNNSLGWDHGNCQNFYTLMGSDLRPDGLGKIVGETQLVGTPKTNEQFNSPLRFNSGAGDSFVDTHMVENNAVAATTYGYFGADNTLPLTGGISSISGRFVKGDSPIDQTNNVANLFQA